MRRIDKIIVHSGYRLELRLSDGMVLVLDFNNKLNTVRFGRLADNRFFERVTSDGEVLKWGSEIELSLNEVLAMVKK